MNILLNVLIKRATAEQPSFLAALVSREFLFAYFVVGTASLSGMLAFYFFNKGLSFAQGMLFMGAFSVVGGAVLGMVTSKQLLHPVEIMLLCAITAFLVWRYIALSAVLK